MFHELIRIARAEVGIREEGGNNRGARVRLYQQATSLAPGAWPWCAAFTAWALRQWLLTDEGRLYLKGTAGANWRCISARAFSWEEWGRTKGLQLLHETALAKAGDFVTFDFSHIGIVLEDQTDARSPIVTVEGNTNGKGERDSEAGDGVWIKRREPKLVKTYIRLGKQAP